MNSVSQFFYPNFPFPFSISLFIFLPTSHPQSSFPSLSTIPEAKSHNFPSTIQQFIKRARIRLYNISLNIFFQDLQSMDNTTPPEMTHQEIIIPPETYQTPPQKPFSIGSRTTVLGLTDKKQCRVCLEDKQEEGNQLIKTCRCTGSLKYIHRGCLQDWLLRKYEETDNRNEFNTGNGLICQICHSQYLINYSIELQRGNCSTFTAKIKVNKCVAAVNIIFVAASLFCLVLSVAYAVQDTKKPEYTIKQAKFFLVYVAILLAFISSIYGVYQFIRAFAMEEKIVIRTLDEERETRYVCSVQKQFDNCKQMGKEGEER